MILLWDHRNVAHIREHSVIPEEAAEVVESARRPFPQRLGPGKFLVRGQTSRGRYLQVIYVRRLPEMVDPEGLSIEDRLALEADEEFGYVIHARDLSNSERRSVRRRADKS